MPDIQTLATILLMAASTYATRILGYVALRDRTLSPRMRAVMATLRTCLRLA
jgi:uncharacterized membrane protein